MNSHSPAVVALEVAVLGAFTDESSAKHGKVDIGVLALGGARLADGCRDGLDPVGGQFSLDVNQALPVG